MASSKAILAACAAAFLVASNGTEAGAGDDRPLFLHVVPTAVAVDARVDASRPLRVALYVRDPERLAAALDVAGALVELPNRLVIGLSSDPRLAGEPAEHTGTSFLIDYDDEVFPLLEAEAVLGEQATPDELREFVNGYLSAQSPLRGWESASRTAKLRSGDCTEHAMLLTALARSRGFPARVIIGTALVAGPKFAAYGHAWTEIYDAGKWRRQDATGIDRVAAVHYIPQGVADESPGHALQNAGTLQRMGIQRITILSNVD